MGKSLSQSALWQYWIYKLQMNDLLSLGWKKWSCLSRAWRHPSRNACVHVWMSIGAYPMILSHCVCIHVLLRLPEALSLAPCWISWELLRALEGGTLVWKHHALPLFSCDHGKCSSFTLVAVLSAMGAHKSGFNINPSHFSKGMWADGGLRCQTFPRLDLSRVMKSYPGEIEVCITFLIEMLA